MIFSRRILLISLLLAAPCVAHTAPKGDREFSVGQLIERLASPKKAARQQAEQALRALDRAVWDALREASKNAASEGVRKRASDLHSALTEAAILELLPTRKSSSKPRRWEQIWSGSSLPYLRAFRDQGKAGEVLVVDLWSRLRLSSVGALVLSKLLVQRKVKCDEVGIARDVARDYLAASFAYWPLSGVGDHGAP